MISLLATADGASVATWLGLLLSGVGVFVALVVNPLRDRRERRRAETAQVYVVPKGMRPPAVNADGEVDLVVTNRSASPVFDLVVTVLDWDSDEKMNDTIAFRYPVAVPGAEMEPVNAR